MDNNSHAERESVKRFFEIHFWLNSSYQFRVQCKLDIKIQHILQDLKYPQAFSSTLAVLKRYSPLGFVNA